MSKQKKVTTEELAIMIKRGFDETVKKVDMEARFDEVDKRFVEVDKRFDEMATKLELKEMKEELQKDIAHIQSLPTSLGRRLDRIEDDMRLVKTKVGIH